MYVDESGDTGLVNSPTDRFVLSGLVIHESRWRDFINQMADFRKTMRAVHKLPLRTEIHAAHFIKSPPVRSMPRYTRLAILRNLLDELAKMDFISITTVVVRKQGKPADYDVFHYAWQALFQRFENTLKFGNFPGGHRNDFGIVLTDATDGKRLTRMVRRMSVVNYIPSQFGSSSRNIPILRIIEDPHPKDSRSSFFIQAADACAYFAMQRARPNAFIKRSNAERYFDRLLPILNKKASPSHRFGVVVL
jgi:hypothetical protein